MIHLTTDAIQNFGDGLRFLDRAIVGGGKLADTKPDQLAFLLQAGGSVVSKAPDKTASALGAALLRDAELMVIKHDGVADALERHLITEVEARRIQKPGGVLNLATTHALKARKVIGETLENAGERIDPAPVRGGRKAPARAATAESTSPPATMSARQAAPSKTPAREPKAKRPAANTEATPAATRMVTPNRSAMPALAPATQKPSTERLMVEPGRAAGAHNTEPLPTIGMPAANAQGAIADAVTEPVATARAISAGSSSGTFPRGLLAGGLAAVVISAAAAVGVNLLVPSKRDEHAADDDRDSDHSAAHHTRPTPPVREHEWVHHPVTPTVPVDDYLGMGDQRRVHGTPVSPAPGTPAPDAPAPGAPAPVTPAPVAPDPVASPPVAPAAPAPAAPA
ncbi:MAG: hypothetical protein JWN41_200, partial [Thermoleophilia bacterium]|nr:hypothetical protein [Thermoleophilia bacterium]